MPSMPSKDISSKYFLAAVALISLILFSITFVPLLPTHAQSDETPPEVVAWDFVPDSINTEAAAQEITLYLRVTDDVSGVTSFPYLQFQAIDTTGESIGSYIRFNFSLMTEGCDALGAELIDGLGGTCGDAMDGIYAATATLPRYAPKGEWKVGRVPLDPPVDGQTFTQVGSVEIGDEAGNYIDTYLEDTLNISFINNATIEDIIAPVVHSVSISPTAFDTNAGDVSITIDMHITDNLSGIITGSETLNNVTISPLLNDMVYADLVSFEKISGTYTDGNFRMVLNIPQYSLTGFWLIRGINVLDTIGNEYSVGGYRSLSETFPDLELFLANQALANEVLIENEWILEDFVYRDENHNLVWPDISVKFEAGTVVSKQEGGVFAFHRMLSENYLVGGNSDINAFMSQMNEQYRSDLDACNPSEGCVSSELNTSNMNGRPVHMVKVGIPGLNLSFSKPVTITLRVDKSYLGETFTIQTFNAGQNQWSNQTTCVVKMVEPSSYEHGGDQYGEITPAPYPGCVFTTDHASFFSANTAVLSETGMGSLPVLIGAASALVAGGYVFLFIRRRKEIRM